MKKILLLLCLLLGATTVSAQGVNYYPEEKREADYRAEMKERLAIDYSMPDYETKKIDPKASQMKWQEWLIPF